MTHVNHNSPNFTDPRERKLCPRCGQECLPNGVCHCGATPISAEPTITQLVMALVTTIEFSSPAEIRESARQLDDLGNDPAISAKRRPLYRALSDVVKSWR